MPGFSTIAAANRIVSELLEEAGTRSMDPGGGTVAIRTAEALGNVLRLMMAKDTLAPDGQIAITRLPSERLGEIVDHRPSGYIRGSVQEARLKHLPR